MERILKYLNIQIILVILINLLMADITIISIPILLFGLLLGAGWDEILCVYVCIFVLFLSLIR